MTIATQTLNYAVDNLEDSVLESDRNQAKIFALADVPTAKAFGITQEYGQGHEIITDIYIPGRLANLRGQQFNTRDHIQNFVTAKFRSPLQLWNAESRITDDLTGAGVTAGDNIMVANQRMELAAEMYREFDSIGGSNAIGAYQSATEFGLSGGVAPYCGTTLQFNVANGPTRVNADVTTTATANRTETSIFNNAEGRVGSAGLPQNGVRRASGTAATAAPSFQDILGAAIGIKSQMGAVSMGMNNNGMSVGGKMMDFICLLPAQVIRQLTFNQNTIDSRYRINQASGDSIGPDGYSVPTEAAVVETGNGTIALVGTYNQVLHGTTRPSSAATGSATVADPRAPNALDDRYVGCVTVAGATNLVKARATKYLPLNVTIRETRFGINCLLGWRAMHPLMGTSLAGMLDSSAVF